MHAHTPAHIWTQRAEQRQRHREEKIVVTRQVKREKSLPPFCSAGWCLCSVGENSTLLTPQLAAPLCFLHKSDHVEWAFWNKGRAVEKGWEMVHQSKTSPEAASKQGQVPGCVHIHIWSKPWGNIFVFLPWKNFKNIMHHSKVEHLRQSFSFQGITSPIASFVLLPPG